MSKKHEYVLVDGDDWSGLFYNGQLLTEGHYIELGDLGDTVVENGGRITRFETLRADDEWLAEGGRFPRDLREVKFEDGIMLPSNLYFAPVQGDLL